jgi:hypothetical protein
MQVASDLLATTYILGGHMGLKAMVLAGTALATLTAGLATPALATTQAISKTTAAVQTAGGEHDDDISGLVNESPVCSALGAETIPTGDVVARCLAGTTLI